MEALEIHIKTEEKFSLKYDNCVIENPDVQETCVSLKNQLEVDRKPLIQTIKPINHECKSVDLKYNLNLVPFIKLERKKEIENAIMEDNCVPGLQEACVSLKNQLEVDRKPLIQTIKPINHECKSVDLKYNLNLVPFIKLERKKEIENAIMENKNLLMNIKPKVELVNQTKQVKNNEDHDDQDYEQNSFSETENENYIHVLENSLLSDQESPNLTFFVCPMCNECQTSRDELNNHTCSNRTCEKCFRKFKTVRDCINHSCPNSDNPFKCDVCHKGFATLKNKELHSKYCYDKRKSLECEHCNVMFNTMVELNKHLKLLNKKDKYQCEECGRSFSNKRVLSVHIRRHMGLLSFRCQYCDKTFAQRSHLKIHLSGHRKEKRFSCDKCDLKFARSNSLKNHKLVHTGSVLPFKCSQCDKRFAQQALLTVHSKIHSNRQFDCDECDKRFYRMDHLKVHKRIHSGEKPYVCGHCGKAFSQNSALTIHKRVHNKVKPFQCNECDAQFKHKSTLLLHLRSHTNDKPYKCEHCDKRFTQISNCYSHVRSVHQREQLTCYVCKKVCSQRTNLSTHLKTVHDDKFYKCRLCKKLIKSKYHFHNHVQFHLKEEDL